jgi:hypothetical protein
MPRPGRVHLYSLLISVLGIATLGGVWWLVHNAPAPIIEPASLSSNRAPDAPAATIDESLGATDLALKGLSFSVTGGDDGRMKMELEAKEANKLRSLYTIHEGSMQFFINEKNTLVIGLNNASYSREAGVVRVSGTLIGRIAEGGQYFKAEELSWDEAQMKVSTKEVQYVGPNLEVSGRQMSIDMRTGEVSFDGPVDVGI